MVKLLRKNVCLVHTAVSLPPHPNTSLLFVLMSHKVMTFLPDKKIKLYSIRQPPHVIAD